MRRGFADAGDRSARLRKVFLRLRLRAHQGGEGASTHTHLVLHADRDRVIGLRVVSLRLGGASISGVGLRERRARIVVGGAARRQEATRRERAGEEMGG